MTAVGLILAGVGLAVVAVAVFLQARARKNGKSLKPGFISAAAGVCLMIAGVMLWLF